MNVQTFRNSFLKNRPSGFGNKDCVPSFEFSVLIMIFEMVCRRIIETKDVFLKYCKADNPPITLETIEKIIKLADHFTGFSQFGYKTMQSQAQLVHQFFTYDIFIGCLEWFGTGKNNNGKIKWLQGDEQDDDLHDDDISEKIEGLQLEQSASRDSTKDDSHFSVKSSSSSSSEDSDDNISEKKRGSKRTRDPDFSSGGGQATTSRPMPPAARTRGGSQEAASPRVPPAAATYPETVDLATESSPPAAGYGNSSFGIGNLEPRFRQTTTAPNFMAGRGMPSIVVPGSGSGFYQGPRMYYPDQQTTESIQMALDAGVARILERDQMSYLNVQRHHMALKKEVEDIKNIASKNKTEIEQLKKTIKKLTERPRIQQCKPRVKAEKRGDSGGMVPEDKDNDDSDQEKGTSEAPCEI